MAKIKKKNKMTKIAKIILRAILRKIVKIEQYNINIDGVDRVWSQGVILNKIRFGAGVEPLKSSKS